MTGMLSQVDNKSRNYAASSFKCFIESLHWPCVTDDNQHMLLHYYTVQIWEVGVHGKVSL